MNREPDEVVPVLVDTGTALREGLLQAVSDDDDLVVLAQLSPDFLGIVRGKHAGFRHREESGMSHFTEVQAFRGISQPDRHWDGMAFGEEPGQPDQDRRLARAHATDQQVRPAGIGVMYILHDHSAQLVAADDLTNIRRGGLDQVLWVGLRFPDDRRRHVAEAVEEEYRRGQGHR